MKQWIIWKRNNGYREREPLERPKWLLLSYKVPSEPSTNPWPFGGIIKGLGALRVESEREFVVCEEMLEEFALQVFDAEVKPDGKPPE